MSDKRAKPQEQEQIQPIVFVDQARERPDTVDPTAADISGLTDDRTDTREDVTPEETTAIYQKGVTIQPPG